MYFTVITQSYFDGRLHHDQGPYTFTLKNGCIESVEAGEHIPAGREASRVEFLMPSFVEGHCHIFLDGAELGLQERSDYLKAPFEEMVRVAQRNLETSLAAGITLVRDAGDKYGINHHVRSNSPMVTVRLQDWP